MSKKFLLLCFGLNIAMCNVYAVDTNQSNLNQKTITATGHADISVPQSIATMDFTISKTSDNAKDAQQSVRYASDKLVNILKTQSYLSLQTIGMNVTPNISYKDNTSTVVGYTATYTVEVKSKITDAGKLMDKAIDNGANIMNNPIFSASDSDRAKAQLDAISAATLNAKAQAEASLKAIGMKSNGIKQITILSNNSPTPPVPRVMAMRMNSNSAPSTQVDGGSDNISADVSVVISY